MKGRHVCFAPRTHQCAVANNPNQLIELAMECSDDGPTHDVACVASHSMFIGRQANAG